MTWEEMKAEIDSISEWSQEERRIWESIRAAVDYVDWISRLPKDQGSMFDYVVAGAQSMMSEINGEGEPDHSATVIKREHSWKS